MLSWKLVSAASGCRAHRQGQQVRGGIVVVQVARYILECQIGSLPRVGLQNREDRGFFLQGRAFLTRARVLI